TKATYQGELFASVIDRFANGVKVETQVCPELVLLVEQGAPDNSEARQTIHGYLAPLQAAGIDELVLGCTDFPFYSPQFRAELGPGVEIVDPGPAVARQVVRVLERDKLANETRENGSVRYITTGDPDHMRDLIKGLLGEPQAAVEVARWAGD